MGWLADRFWRCRRQTQWLPGHSLNPGACEIGFLQIRRWSSKTGLEAFWHGVRRQGECWGPLPPGRPDLHGQHPVEDRLGCVGQATNSRRPDNRSERNPFGNIEVTPNATASRLGDGRPVSGFWSAPQQGRVDSFFVPLWQAEPRRSAERAQNQMITN